MKPLYRTPTRQLGFFAPCFESFPRKLASGQKHLLELFESINWESFRGALQEQLSKQSARTVRRSNAGRRPWDPLFLLRSLFLQRRLGLSDNAFEQQVSFNLLYQHLLGILDPADIPDSKTLWKYRELFTKAAVFTRLFELSALCAPEKPEEPEESRKPEEQKKSEGNKPAPGELIIDSSFVEAPRQRNTREENRLIKLGKGAELWNDRQHKKIHKDIDARWTKKRREVHYGYKAHVIVEASSKIITGLLTTAASVHDAKAARTLLEKIPQKAVPARFFADAGYVGEKIEKLLEDKKFIPLICEKGTRGHPLTQQQQDSNRKKSRIRSRIEHVFGYIEGTMEGFVVRSIGLARAVESNALTAWVYNICRQECVKRCQ